MKKGVNIIQGTVNNILSKEQDLYESRIVVCLECEHSESGSIGLACTICGCILGSKTRVPEEECPQKKWLSVNQVA
jgi:hypothetical protein